VVDHPRLQDGKGEHWDQAVLRQLIEGAIREKGIETVLTFDEGGVSGHPNHRAVHQAVRWEPRGMVQVDCALELVLKGPFVSRCN
jgi:hypothetical protein